MSKPPHSTMRTAPGIFDAQALLGERINAAAVADLECKLCGSLPGKPCLDTSGRERPPHPNRWDRARAQLAAEAGS